MTALITVIIWTSVLLFAIRCSADQTTKISAILYQDAFLPCETRRSIKVQASLSQRTDRHWSEDINLLLWYRQGQTVPFYTIDARSLLTEHDERVSAKIHPQKNIKSDGDLSLLAAKGKHHKNDSRLELDLGQLTPMLRIRNVTEEDEGLYQCRVEYAGQRTFISEIRLSIIGAPVSLQITDVKGNRFDGEIGPFDEFESITLVCTAYGGRPKPRVIWFKQKSYHEELIDDSYEYQPLTNPVNGTLSSVTNVLHLRRLDRHDYRARYMCRASTHSYYPPLTQTVIIDMNLVPVNVHIYSSLYHTSPQSSTLIAGQVTQFFCRTDGSKPAAKIEWFLDHQRIVVTGNDENHYEPKEFNSNASLQFTIENKSNNRNIQPVTSTEQAIRISPLPLTASSSSSSSSSSSMGRFLSVIESHEVNNTLSVIRFVPQHSDNGLTLACHAWNPFIGNSKIIDKLTLDVKYAPQLTIDIGGSSSKQQIVQHWPLSQEHQYWSSQYAQAAELVPTGGNLSSAIVGGAYLKQPSKLLMVTENAPLLELNCHIRANPWIDQVIWYRNGQPITPTSAAIGTSSSPIVSVHSDDDDPFYTSSISTSTFSARLTQNQQTSIGGGKRRHQLVPALYLTNHNQTLRVENVHRYHGGLYQCSARNSVNVTHSEIIQLNVAYKPHCIHNRTRYIDVVRNVPLELFCVVDANPFENITFQWTLYSPWNGKEVDLTDLGGTLHDRLVLVDNRTISALDVEQAVQRLLQHENVDITHMTKDSADGMHENENYSSLLLQCDAQNIAGPQESPCTFFLRIVNGPPQKVSNCTFTLEQFDSGTTSATNSKTVNNQLDQQTTSDASQKRQMSADGLDGSVNKNKINSGSTMLVQCNGGNDGGKEQTFHLIGWLSSATESVISAIELDKSQRFSHSLQDISVSSSSTINASSTYKDFLDSDSTDSTGLSTTLIKALIQSIHSLVTTNVTDDNISAQNQSFTKLTSLLRWNLLATKWPHFRIDQVWPEQRYDLAIYAQNLIGPSEPIIYRNLLLLPEHANANQANGTFPKPNWAYLRFKGLVVVLLLLLIMGLIGLAIKSYLFTTSLYELGSHSFDDVSASTEINEAETMFQQQQQRSVNVNKFDEQTQASNSHDKQIGGNSRVANQYAGHLKSHHQGYDEESQNKIYFEHKITKLENETLENCPNPSNRKRKETSDLTCTDQETVVNLQLVTTITSKWSTVRRFLNRFVLINSSRYRSYHLAHNDSDDSAPTFQTTELNYDNSNLPAPNEHERNSHSTQECINWQTNHQLRNSISDVPKCEVGKSRMTTLLQRLRLSTSASLANGLVKSGESELVNDDVTKGHSSSEKNVQLLYVFSRKF